MQHKSTATSRRVKKGLGTLTGALLIAFCSTPQAAILTDTFAINQSATLDGFTNSSAKNFFTVATSFDQFDPGLGTLNSAILSWNITGHITVSGNLEGQAVLSYNGRSASKIADTNGNPPNDVDFSFIDSVSLSSALVEGLGTFNGGDFVGTVANVGGTFPWGATLSALGQITVTYDYTPAVEPPDGEVPEPASLTLLGMAMIAGFGAGRRKR